MRVQDFLKPLGGEGAAGCCEYQHPCRLSRTGSNSRSQPGVSHVELNFPPSAKRLPAQPAAANVLPAGAAVLPDLQTQSALQPKNPLPAQAESAGGVAQGSGMSAASPLGDRHSYGPEVLLPISFREHITKKSPRFLARDIPRLCDAQMLLHRGRCWVRQTRAFQHAAHNRCKTSQWGTNSICPSVSLSVPPFLPKLTHTRLTFALSSTVFWRCRLRPA